MIETVRISFRDFWEYSAAGIISGMVSNRTMDCYQRYMHQYLLPEFGDRELRDITTADIDRMLVRLSCVKPSDAQPRSKAVLNKIFHLAMKRGILSDNPMKGALIIHSGPSETFKLCDEDSVRILSAFQDSSLAQLLTFQFLTGLSRSEVFALRAGGIDFSRKAVTIDQFFLETNSNTYTISKTSKSSRIRSIVIPECAMRVLIYELIIREEKRRRAGESWDNCYDLVFTDDKGNSVSATTFRTEIKRLRKKYELNYSGCPQCQQNFGMMAIEQGVSAMDLQVYLGYKTTDTVRKYYRNRGTQTESLDRYYREAGDFYR